MSIDKMSSFKCVENFTFNKVKRLIFSIIILFPVFWAATFDGKAHAATWQLILDPSPDARVVGYKLYYGTSEKFGVTVDLKSNTSYVLQNLSEGATYYFAASAYDSFGNESTLSDVLVYKIPQTTDIIIDNTNESATSQTTDIIIDNNNESATSKTGNWGVSEASNYYGGYSVWSRDGSTFTWHFNPTRTGYHDLMMWWTEWPSRSKRVPVDIRHADGTTTVVVDQTINGGKWNSLGDFYFESGQRLQGNHYFPTRSLQHLC